MVFSNTCLGKTDERRKVQVLILQNLWLSAFNSGKCETSSHETHSVVCVCRFFFWRKGLALCFPKWSRISVLLACFILCSCIQIMYEWNSPKLKNIIWKLGLIIKGTIPSTSIFLIRHHVENDFFWQTTLPVWAPNPTWRRWIISSPTTPRCQPFASWFFARWLLKDLAKS